MYALSLLAFLLFLSLLYTWQLGVRLIRLKEPRLVILIPIGFSALIALAILLVYLKL